MYRPGKEIVNPTAGAAGRRQTEDRTIIGAENDEDYGKKKRPFWEPLLLKDLVREEFLSLRTS